VPTTFLFHSFVNFLRRWIVQASVSLSSVSKRSIVRSTREWG